jgi:hypothetical protein
MSWPGEESKALEKTALARLQGRLGLTVTAGPLSYGLVHYDGQWWWSVALGTQNFQRVLLDAVELIRAADFAGLPARWRRSSLDRAVLSADIPLLDRGAVDEATRWFIDALNELESSDVLKPFIDAVSARASVARVVPPTTVPMTEVLNPTHDGEGGRLDTKP